MRPSFSSSWMFAKTSSLFNHSERFTLLFRFVSLFFNKVAGWNLSYRTPPDDCFCFILFHSVMAETFIINETPFIKFYRTFEWKSASVNITVNIQLTKAFILKKFSKFDSFKWKSSKLNVSNEKLVNLSLLNEKVASSTVLNEKIIGQFPIKKCQNVQFWQKK